MEFLFVHDVLNNEVISEFVGCDGVLAITKDHLKIVLNELKKTLVINGKSITNLVDSFVVLDDGYPSAAILTSSAIGNSHSGSETTGESDENLTDELAGTQDWDVKCNCCGWRGLADETKYDAEEDLSICPNCDDNELEANSQDGNIDEANSSDHQPSTKYWDYSCAKCMWQGLDGETVFNDDNTPCCPSCNSPELNPNLDNSWDFKCNCCGWRGLADETKYDAEEDLSICPNCDDNELETSSEMQKPTTNEESTSRIILSLGFIPTDWVAASDGGKTIIVGDTDHSRTVEYEYEINDDGFVNLTTGKALGGSMNDIYKALGADSDALSNGHGRIADVILKNIYEVCLEEADELDSYIALYEEGISDFANNRKKYNGCFYCRYVVEDGGNIEKELLFAIKPK